MRGLIKIKKTILLLGIVLLLIAGVAHAGNYNASESRLQVTDVTVDVDGDEDKGIADGGIVGEKIKPGSKVDIEIELFNNYADIKDEDFNIEDVEITVIISEIDDGDDLEESDEISKISAQNDKKASVSFEIPWELEEDDYDVEIEITADDENRTDYQFTYEFTLEVDRDKHNIKIMDASLDPETILCKGTSTLFVEILNIGEEDEDEVILTIKNADLGLDVKESELELDSGVDDDSRFSEVYTIDAEDLGAGTYPITIRAFYKEGKETDNQKVNLVIEECVVEEEEEVVPEEEEVEVIMPEEEEEETVTPEVVVKESFWDQYGLALIIAAYIVVILIGILVLVKLFKK